MSIKLNNILELFIEDSYRKFNVREVARLVKISPGSASKHLHEATKKNLLNKEKTRNLLLFSANLENQNFKDLKIYSNIEKIRNSELIDFINNELNYPEVIILFGSYAKGENQKNSDIDLFILTESKKQIDLSDFEKELKTKVQLFVYSRKDMEKMKSDNKELLNNIINGIKLSGYMEIFI